jgi:lipopolysaccharide transport system permease protein
MTQNELVTIIRPPGSRFGFDRAYLSDLWAHRELLYFLTWRDIKIRYKQTAIGVFWAVLQPVLTTAVFTILFGIVARFDTAAIPYPLFALSGLLIWLFVHSSITMASTSFVNNANLVTKVFFPRLVVPIAATLASLFDLIFAFAILVLLMIWFGTVVSFAVLLAPVFLVLGLIQAVAFGTLFSALNVRFRDVKFALPFLLQVWMIASPIFYPASIIPDRWRLLFALNPLTGIIEGFRSSLFGTEFNMPLIAISIVSLVLLTAFSLIAFRMLEDDFADVI